MHRTWQCQLFPNTCRCSSWICVKYSSSCHSNFVKECLQPCWGYHSKLPKGWCHGLSDFEWNSGHTSIPQGICQRSCLLRPDMLIFWDLLRPPRWDYWPEIQKSFLCISGPVCQCQYQGASAWLHVATPKAVIGQSKVASSMPISNKYECFIPYT